MKIALVNSRQDKAGLNIRHHLEELLADDGPGGWKIAGRSYSFYDVEERLIHAEAVDREIEADLLVFLSRHSSVNPVPVLTVHVTGNYGAAELGGTPASAQERFTTPSKRNQRTEIGAPERLYAMTRPGKCA